MGVRPVSIMASMLESAQSVLSFMVSRAFSISDAVYLFQLVPVLQTGV
jgi:hypothetical protein